MTGEAFLAHPPHSPPSRTHPWGAQAWPGIDAKGRPIEIPGKDPTPNGTRVCPGVIFFGDDDGQLVAVDARDGKHLWHYQMGEGLTASPITYAVDGKQYVSIASATAIFSFGLFEPVQPVAIPKAKTH